MNEASTADRVRATLAEARERGSLEAASAMVAERAAADPALGPLAEALACLESEARNAPEMPSGGAATMPLQGRGAAAFHARMMNFDLARGVYEELVAEGGPELHAVWRAVNLLCIASAPRKSAATSFDDKTRVAGDQELPLSAFDDDPTKSVVLPEHGRHTMPFEAEMTSPGSASVRSSHTRPFEVEATMPGSMPAPAMPSGTHGFGDEPTDVAVDEPAPTFDAPAPVDSSSSASSAVVVRAIVQVK
ncbi:MAG: hypothetical protein AAF411_00995 [Myxococcota bacterium]